MLTAELTQLRLDLRGHLMRTTRRSMRPVRQRGDPTGLIAPHPRMHTLTRHAEPDRDLRHRLPVTQDGHHCLVSLFHHVARNEHGHTILENRAEKTHQPLSSIS